MKNLKDGFTPLKFNDIKIITRGWYVDQSKSVSKLKVDKTLTGFTLIEVVIYLSLLLVMFGAVTGILYAVLESSNKDWDRIILQTEGDFILAKINWALGDATTTSVSNQPAKLIVNKSGYLLNPIMFDQSSGRMEIKEGNFTVQYLSSSLVTVSNFSIQNIFDAKTLTQGVIVDFSLLAPTKVKQSFHLTKYIPK